MRDLIEALTILAKYMLKEDDEYPTTCDRDDFIVVGVDIGRMTISDLRRLYQLGFLVGTDWDYTDKMPDPDENDPDEEWQKLIDYATEQSIEDFHSFRFGSC